MKAATVHYRQNFLVVENGLTHLVKRLVRKYHLGKLAKKMRIELAMPPYPHYGF